MRRNYVVRNYIPQDFTAYVRLNISFSKSDAVKRIDSLEALTQMLKKPGYRAINDLFIAEANGMIVGCANVVPELGIGRVVLDYLVHPAYCTGSMPEELINRALQRAKELGAQVAHINIASVDLAAEELLLKLGFEVERRSHELRLDLSKTRLEAIESADSMFRHLQIGEEERLAEIQNLCFADTWGYDSGTAEHVNWWLNFRRNCLDDVILAWDGNSVIGYCWMGISCGSDLATGKSKGRIYMLGVSPEYRNKAIGKKMLVTGLLYLQGKGREIIDITVDSQNAAAIGLYCSMGFQVVEDTLWYQKAID